MTIETITLTAPIDTKFTVELDTDWAGRWFAGLCADEQADMFAAMVRHMSPFALQWDYVSIEIDRLPNAREIRDILTMLGTDHD